jgi:hypothetical protein
MFARMFWSKNQVPCGPALPPVFDCHMTLWCESPDALPESPQTKSQDAHAQRPHGHGLVPEAFQPHAFWVLLAARRPSLVVVLVAIMPPA